MQRHSAAEIRLVPDGAGAVRVPFFRPQVGEEEMNEVMATLQSGWLTTGPKVKAFEEEFAKAVNGRYAVALNSCTAALHLAVEALDLREGDAVLVPTMTFAATAEIILYRKAVPVLVDCDPVTGNIDLEDAERKVEQLRKRSLPFLHGRELNLVGIIPVHVGGYMLDVDEVQRFADKHGLWVIEDAAHAFPSAWRPDSGSRWRYCGENTSAVSCFSFYANKTITTGEGGMAVTDDKEVADKIRLMSLHGLSHDAWGRYSGSGSWDYRIVQAGYKYNMTDIAAAVGLRQLDRAEEMRKKRQDVAERFLSEFADIAEIRLPISDENRLHSWHLFPIRLNLESIRIDRNEFINELNGMNVGTSVHWRPLHKHPLYQERLGWTDAHFPSATKLWKEIISLPIFSAMTADEIDHVVGSVIALCSKFATNRRAVASGS